MAEARILEDDWPGWKASASKRAGSRGRAPHPRSSAGGFGEPRWICCPDIGREILCGGPDPRHAETPLL